jgi:hypothetical protein
MVSFKFRTSKTVNFATDVPSKHGFHLNDLNRIYGAEDLRINGFTPKNVSQVITGAKKSHAGYIFLDFFKLPKEEKEKYINLIDITTKI